jgi:hypothetical protein
MKLFTMLLFMFGHVLAYGGAADGKSFGDYQLVTWYPMGPGIGYRILKNGEEVFSTTVAGFRVISVSHGKEVDTSQPKATDITGDGVPDLIIEEFPRLPGCCWTYSIFGLGQEFHEIAHLSGFSGPMTFEDVNHNSEYEITGVDTSFGCWYASPRIVFGYIRKEYRLATGLMRHPSPSLDVLAGKAREFSRATKPAGFAIAPEAYQYLLDLAYSGNMKSAWRLVDLLWPAKDAKTKPAFHQDFLDHLQESPYWDQIRIMNGMS